MKYVWVKTKEKHGYKTIFRYFTKGKEGKLLLSAGPIYSVYFDDTFVSYGPERTAYPYSRKREINIPQGVKKIEVLVLVYGVPSLDLDDGDPFFGAELFEADKIVGDTSDFKAYQSSMYDTRFFKYSFQRGFGERFDLRNIKEQELEVVEIPPLKLIDGIGDVCKYREAKMMLRHIQPFDGFEGYKIPNYINDKSHPEYRAFDIEKEFIQEVKSGYMCYTYSLDYEMSGLIKIDIECEEDDTQIFVVFDEYLPYGKWQFGRSSCVDLITINSNRGKKCVISSTIYALKFLRILANKKVKIFPTLITVQNDSLPDFKPTGNDKIDGIVWAARNTFMQNAVDIYTDCPGRERGGWLCDGFFTSMAETYFTGKNKIEKKFLENFILGEYPELEKGMFPMVFPAHESLFIPNWAMWFVLELEQYYKKTKDQEMVDKAKEKVLKLCKYFEAFENEYSLLENLHSWVFVEWSAAGTEDFVKGVSFPTNMLYCQMLKSVTNLYKDEKYAKKAAKIQQNINILSFNGKLFIDNALRIDGALTPIKEHTSETCQYYALFFNITDNKELIHFVKDELGPKRKNKYPEIPQSNSFIGNYLRFLWLHRIGERDRIKDEAVEYFFHMAEQTGTLWEKNVPASSCNHGFASSIAPILMSDK